MIPGCDNFAEAVESIHDVFFVCFRASHGNSPFLPHGALHGFSCIYNSEGQQLFRLSPLEYP